MKVIFPRMETMQFHDAYDGGSKFIHYLAEGLAELGVEVEIVSARPKGKKIRNTVHNKVKYTFIPPAYSGIRGPLNIMYKLAFSRNLARYLEKTDFDVLHSTEMFAYFYLMKRKRKPVIFQCWALEAWPSEKESDLRGIKKFYNEHILRFFWKYCIEKSESVASDGEHQLPRLKKIGVPRRKIWFIPNGVTFRKIQEYGRKSRNRRKELGIGGKDIVVLSVCQMAPGKGIMDIVDGFALVKKEMKNAKLIMIGRGMLEDEMHEAVKKYGLEKDIFHLKNLPESALYDYFFSSDIFLSAATSEAFLICIQEGMAAGLPIVSSAQPFLVKNGVNGYVVGFNNPKGIKNAILKICGSGRMKEMGAASRKMAAQYDYGILSKTAANEYRKLCGVVKKRLPEKQP